MSQSQRFLFLQGVNSPFFRRLARTLRNHGHQVRKINFTAGDRLYWRSGDAQSYRGAMTDLKPFYENQFEKYKISDIVLFGDCRPVHRPAIELARARGIQVHVYEEGYFRPFWVTLERHGVNANSSLPRNPDWYRQEAKITPHYGNGQSFSAPFWKRAAYDVGYNFWAGLNPILHSGVESHVPYSPMTEYLGYVRRAIRIQCSAPQSRRIENQLTTEAAHAPYYLLPLQLDADSQIVHHSPFENMAQVMESVVQSFAKQAPEGTRLAVKIHPLDPGLRNYRRILSHLAERLNIENRVFYLESGNLPKLLNHTAGVVTVNSTVGSSALIHGKPTIALGWALYGLTGLTFQDGLDDFWSNPGKPDMKLFRNFRDVVIHNTQINGGFYSKSGIQLAIANSIPKLCAGSPSAEVRLSSVIDVTPAVTRDRISLSE